MRNQRIGDRSSGVLETIQENVRRREVKSSCLSSGTKSQFLGVVVPRRLTETDVLMIYRTGKVGNLKGSKGETVGALPHYEIIWG